MRACVLFSFCPLHLLRSLSYIIGLLTGVTWGQNRYWLTQVWLGGYDGERRSIDMAGRMDKRGSDIREVGGTILWVFQSGDVGERQKGDRKKEIVQREGRQRSERETKGRKRKRKDRGEMISEGRDSIHGHFKRHQEISWVPRLSGWQVEMIEPFMQCRYDWQVHKKVTHCISLVFPLENNNWDLSPLECSS